MGQSQITRLWEQSAGGNLSAARSRFIRPMERLVDLILLYWLFLTALTFVGGLIGAWQLREPHQRVSLYLSRILIAVSLRSLLAFIGIYHWRETVRPSTTYVACSAFGATLLCGAIWGWLFYVAGLWNGDGWRGFYHRLRGKPDD